MYQFNMDVNAVGIPIMFIIIGAIMLWFLLSGKRLWWLKAIFVTICCFFVFLLWHSVSFLSGWPTERKLPQKFEVHWIVVDEGNKNDKGNIFVWATPLNEQFVEQKPETTHWWKFKFVPDKRPKTPISYKLNYSRELHQQAIKALQAIRQGRRIVGQRNGTGKPGANGREKDKKGKGKGSLYHYNNNNKFIFYNFPAPKLPPKNIKTQKPNFNDFMK